MPPVCVDRRRQSVPRKSIFHMDLHQRSRANHKSFISGPYTQHVAHRSVCIRPLLLPAGRCHAVLGHFPREAQTIMLPQFDVAPKSYEGRSDSYWTVEPESAMIARAKAGDPDAISALYERYAPQIQRYIASRLGDPVQAEDVCADVFVKVLESLGRYEDRGWPFSAWLYRIAYARTVDVLRQASRRHSIPLDETQLGSLEPPDEAVMTHIS